MPVDRASRQVMPLLGAFLLLMLGLAQAQVVPPEALPPAAPSAVPLAAPTWPSYSSPAGTSVLSLSSTPLLLLPPNVCATQPCLQAAPVSARSSINQPPPTLNAAPASDGLTLTQAGELPSYGVNAYDIARSALVKPYTQMFPELPGAAGFGADVLGIALKSGDKVANGASPSDVAASAAKELTGAAVGAVVDQVVTTAVTCIAGETGPAAVVIGTAAGYCAGQGVQYVFDHPAPQHCDEFGVCFDSQTLPPDPQLDAERQRMTADFNQTISANAAAKQTQAAAAADDETSEPADSGYSMNAWLSALQPTPTPLRSSPSLGTPSQGPPIPLGFEKCTCPAQHTSIGIWIDGSLYHAAGIHCK
jgi:hypothetical protein